jgi:VWFA-related protein
MTKSSTLLVMSLAAFSPAGPARAQQQQSFMQVSIIATGKNNVPVEDLTVGEITVKDNNKKQEILSFEKVTAGAPAVQGKPGLHNVVLLDCLNSTYRDLSENRVEILRALGELAKADNLTFLMLRQGLSIVHDPGRPETALRKLAGQGLQGLDGHKPNLELYNWVFTDQQGLFQLFTPAGIFDRRRFEETLRALKTIATNYHGRSGRKNLLWFSQGFPLTIGHDPAGYDVQRLGGNAIPQGRSEDLAVYAKDMDDTGRMLTNANVAIYPIDTRYLSMDDTKSSDRGTLEDLAGETGGVAFLSRRDVAAAVREALNDTRTTYVLRYAISDLKYDGKFHAIKVETSRKDVKLRARKGYYAPQVAKK